MVCVLQKEGTSLSSCKCPELSSKIGRSKAYCVYSTSAAVIGVTETWLDDSTNNSEIDIPNYHLERNDRNREGGGVCVYIRADLAYNHRTDLQHDDIEFVWVKILLPKSKPILVGICYHKALSLVNLKNVA